jgi:hypothetical protein
MKKHVVALSYDKYWLRSVQNALLHELDRVEIVELHSDLQKSFDDLPTPESKALLLLELSMIKDVEQVIAKIRVMSWKYVIAVTADPSAKQATAVLRRNLGYDYWQKTYDKFEIKKQVLSCFEEIFAELLMRSSHGERS